MPVLNRTDPRVLKDGAYSKTRNSDGWQLVLCIGEDDVGRYGFEDQSTLRTSFQPAQGPFARSCVFVMQGDPQSAREHLDRDETTDELR